MAKIPNADIFDIIRNSCLVGFFKMCHTLTHWTMN